jgi:hypothetical protein
VSPIDGAMSSLPLATCQPQVHVLAWPNSWWNTWGTGSSKLQEIWDVGTLGINSAEGPDPLVPTSAFNVSPRVSVDPSGV